MAAGEPFVTQGRCPLPDCEVTLKFDNEQSHLYVCKHPLIQLGDYFKTMFLSNFKEKNQSEIPIQDVSRSEMLLFLRFAMPVENYKAPKPADATELHTLISLADRFIYPKLCQDIAAHLPRWASSWSPNVDQIRQLISLGERLTTNDLNEVIAKHILCTPALYGESTEVKLDLVQTAYIHQQGSTVILEACIRLCANMDLWEVEKLQGQGLDSVMLALYAIIAAATPRLSDAPKHTNRQCRTAAKKFDGLTMTSGRRWWWRCTKCSSRQEATLPFEQIKQLEVKISLAPVDKGVQSDSSITVDKGVQSDKSLTLNNLAMANSASPASNIAQLNVRPRPVVVTVSRATVAQELAVKAGIAVALAKSKALVPQAPKKPTLTKPPTVPNTVTHQVKTTPPRYIGYSSLKQVEILEKLRKALRQYVPFMEHSYDAMVNKWKSDCKLGINKPKPTRKWNWTEELIALATAAISRCVRVWEGFPEERKRKRPLEMCLMNFCQQNMVPLWNEIAPGWMNEKLLLHATRSVHSKYTDPKISWKQDAGSLGGSGEREDGTTDTQETLSLGTRSRPNLGSPQSQSIDDLLDFGGPSPKRQRKEPAVISVDRYVITAYGIYKFVNA